MVSTRGNDWAARTANSPGASTVRGLSRATYAAERHLLVWVEASHHQAVATMRINVLPGHAPQLPDWVEAAWAVTGFVPARVGSTTA